MNQETLLHYALHELQYIALALLVLLYAIKVWQISRLPMPPEMAPARGDATRGVASSFAWPFLPWTMESTRQHWVRWLAFGLYHIGILIAILASFTIPFFPQVMIWPVRVVMVVLIALALVAGLLKLAWRFSRPEIRYVSTPDDFFSLVVLQIWFLLAIPALLVYSPGWLIPYFVLTALLLVYVPLSKISHYIYWFFARFIFGVRYGRRGII